MSLLDLFRPKWRHSNSDVRCYAVTQLRDQALLAEIAKKDTASRVREAAVRKLVDQAMLVEIAKTDPDRDVRIAAVMALADTALLAQIAETETDRLLRQYAVERLIDQVLLARIAGTDRDPMVRGAAVKKLTDQVLLARIAKTDKHSWVRRAAGEKLTDQVLLASIAKTDKDSSVRRAAIIRLTDQAILVELLKTESDKDVRNAAISKAAESCQVLLAEIARAGNDEARAMAKEKLNNPVLQDEILKSAVPCEAAVKMIADQQVLFDIARTETLSILVRSAAVWKIDDTEMLSRLWEAPMVKWDAGRRLLIEFSRIKTPPQRREWTRENGFFYCSECGIGGAERVVLGAAVALHLNREWCSCKIGKLTTGIGMANCCFCGEEAPLELLRKGHCLRCC